MWRQDNTTAKSGYYFYNGQGDVVAIKDANGNNINTYDYDIWGNVLSKAEGMNNPYRYTGEPQDDESGLIYLRARYYDPTVGRFISQDTVEGDLNNPLSMNLYTYVENNPLRYTDPSGHVLQGIYVGANLDNALRYGSSSALYWQVRSNLGSQAQSFIPGAREDGNNTFKYLFSLATMTNENAELNTDGNADWAKQRLVSMFQAQYEADQAFVDGAVAFAIPLEGAFVKGSAAEEAVMAGRLGNAATREQNAQIAKFLQGNGYDITGGGGILKEEYLAGQNGGRLGSNFVDITATKDGQTIRINTVDIYSNGTPTQRELSAANSINAKTGGNIILIPKGSGLGDLAKKLGIDP